MESQMEINVSVAIERLTREIERNKKEIKAREIDEFKNEFQRTWDRGFASALIGQTVELETLVDLLSGAFDEVETA